MNENILKLFSSKICFSLRNSLKTGVRLFKKEYSVFTKLDEHSCQKSKILWIFIFKIPFNQLSFEKASKQNIDI